MCGVFLLYFASSHARVHFSLYVLNNHNVQHIVSFFRVTWGFFLSFCGKMCAGFLPVQEFCNVPDRILADSFYQPDLIGDRLTSLPLNTSLPVGQREQNKKCEERLWACLLLLDRGENTFAGVIITTFQCSRQACSYRPLGFKNLRLNIYCAHLKGSLWSSLEIFWQLENESGGFRKKEDASFIRMSQDDWQFAT